MTRLQILSDVHTEFHADRGKSFVASLEPDGVDVLVLAGDIAVGDGIGPALDLFCERYQKATVAYLHGNHEFYGSTREHVVAETLEAQERNANLRWLDCDILDVGGIRILGAPLWFSHPGSGRNYRGGINDFSQIIRFESWVYAENKRAIEFFKRELRKGDVAVTHYLPSQKSVAERFVGNVLNIFFLCDIEPLIVEREPAVWIHGHTHDSVDTTIGPTRLVCNPFGYARYQTNPAFKEAAYLNVAPPQEGTTK